MDKEIWKDIPDYEGHHQISNTGKIYSVKRNRMLKQSNQPDGYYRARLCFNGVVKSFLVHRLVATTFIPNPTGLLDVNHIDEDKSNNSVTNLEWMSHKDNINHGTRNHRAAERLKILYARPIVAIFKNGTTKTYTSVRECSESLGLYVTNINRVIRGERKSANGIVFKTL